MSSKDTEAMSSRKSSDSSTADDPIEVALCVICDEAAVGLGPFSRQHLCQVHLNVDVADALKLKEQVDEALREFDCSPDGALDQEAGPLRPIAEMEDELLSIRQTFDAIQQYVDSMRARLTGPLTDRLDAEKKWQRDLDDVRSYNQEVSEAQSVGDTAQLVLLAESMQLSLGDLKTDLARVKSLRVPRGEEDAMQLRRLQQIERQIGRWAEGADSTEHARDASVTAASAEIDAALKSLLFDPIVFSHEVELDGQLDELAVCSDTSGFCSNRSGRVVAIKPTSNVAEVLPQPCIIASFYPSRDHFLVLSIDGSQKLRCHCNIDWKLDINGIHCSRQLLCIAQSDAVTVTDLSGHVVRRIGAQIKGFGKFYGISGNDDFVFVASGNKIGGFCVATGQMKSVITLFELPRADLHCLTIQDNCILVADWKHSRVHKVRIDTQQLVTSYPTERSGVLLLSGPAGVAVDRRGRLFVSECNGHSVRALAADDGTLLWTLGEPGESGSGDGRLNRPRGLAVVTVGQRAQLVVVDRGNKRLLVLTL